MIYHNHFSRVQRSKGQSGQAVLAYITGEQVRSDITGQSFAYGRSERVIATGMLQPEGCSFQAASDMVNSLDKFEKAVNASLFVKNEVALNRDWDLQTNTAVLEEYIHEQFTAHGYPAVYAIHNDADGNNPHAHILVACRAVDPTTGTWTKTKEKKDYVLDSAGNRVPLLDEEGRQKVDKKGRKQWKRKKVSANWIDQKQSLLECRQAWEYVNNERLDQHEQISCLSYADQAKQGLIDADIQPTVHEGYAVKGIERRGGRSIIAELNRQIKEHNQRVMAALQKGMDKVNETIRQLREAFGIDLHAAAQRSSGRAEEHESLDRSAFSRPPTQGRVPDPQRVISDIEDPELREIFEGFARQGREAGSEDEDFGRKRAVHQSRSRGMRM